MEVIYVSMSRAGEIAFGSFYYNRRLLDYVEGGRIRGGVLLIASCLWKIAN